METAEETQMASSIESTLDTLLSTPGIPSTEAAERLSTICTGYLATFAQHYPGKPNTHENYGLSTPGLPTFLWRLWSGVFTRVLNSPIEEPVSYTYITPLIELIGKLKDTPPSEGEQWIVMGETCCWRDLPLLGLECRENFNGPFPTVFTFRPYTRLLSQEGQLAISGASLFELQDLGSDNSESAGKYLANCRRGWLSTQSFISRLWRDCDCNYSLYALWAMRTALEDWPESPPSFDTQYDTLEESPAYLALEVEAAAIWIFNTAPLMYQCTEIWGPNGNLDWPDNAGLPGIGGRRWKGVDGYDREHKRWELWRDLFGEVIRWCDGAGKEHMQGWKVRDAATRALETMKEVEQQ
ncbi:unnamed protein product [Rhizoctonia solani]|uniref:Uncharacterized protein n=1 Tax=Rhizoctonia solani TaxID=456999 RepID=A0A8H3APE0_9AGAM|nr:unnamed protein product [Rhizoctonia solani]